MRQTQIDPLKSLTRSLKIVLVLSIIGSGWSLLSNLTMAISYNMMAQMKDSMLQIMPQYEAAFEMMMSIPRECYILLIPLYALSLVGIIMMWKLRKNGWHCYTLAQLLILMVPVLFLGKAALGLGDVMLTILFIAYYFFTLRNINMFQSKEAQQQPASDTEDTTDIDTTDDNANE